MAVFQLMMAFITNWFLLVVATFGITFAYGGKYNFFNMKYTLYIKSSPRNVRGVYLLYQ